jgi:spore germination protein YaaH
MIKKIFFGIGAIVLGAAIAIGIIFLLGRMVRFDDPILSKVGIHKPQIIGFLPYWLMDKVDKNYTPYITTLTYFGLAVDVDGKPIYLTTPQEEDPGWTTLKGDRLTKVREEAQKNNLKTSLLVHSADEDKIAKLIEHPEEAAHALVSEVGPIMQSRGFTDLNLDIESFLIASPSARINYTLFAKTVAEDVRAANLGTITIEIPPIALVREFLIDPKEIGHIADYVVMMTYDYHYLGSFTTGAVAPIGGAGSTWEFDVETAVKEGVRVIPPEKLILGIPLYGYQWEAMSDRAEAATIPSGASTASLRRVQEILRDCPTCKTALDPVALSPYTIFTKDDVINHIYYENEASMQEKINLAKKYNLGGVALWALGYEDDAILRPLEKYKKSFFLIP